MGHYDDCYDADYEERQERRRQDLIRRITELITDNEEGQDQMALYHLEMIHDIAKSPEMYSNFFVVLGRNFPSR